MVEIRHKETNEQYSHITLDSILDTSCLKDTDGKMRKSLETIYNKSNDIFHWQDDERGTRSCNSLSGSLEYHKSQVLIPLKKKRSLIKWTDPIPINQTKL